MTPSDPSPSVRHVIEALIKALISPPPAAASTPPAS
jgi:hypothetical protein